MSVFTLASAVGAHTATRRISNAALGKLPAEYVTAERVTGAGGKLGKQGATLPLAGLRHLSAECATLAADHKASGAAQSIEMLRRTNTAALRKATLPCPTCFASFYAERGEKASAAGKGYAVDPVTLAAVAVAAPAPAPRKRRTARKASGKASGKASAKG